MKQFLNIAKKLRIRDLEIPNRIVFPPFVTGYSNLDGSMSKRQIDFYKKLAQEGVGMIITGAAAVAPEGAGYKGNTRIDRDAYIPGLRDLFRAIKTEGSVAGIQLYHCGLSGNTSAMEGLRIVAPSPLPYRYGNGVAHELTKEEIIKIEKAFADAAGRAFKAGADFIELHCAHGYLINQFLSPLYNKRIDEYGGTLENRARFALSIIDRTRDALGSDPVIGIRISALEYRNGGYSIEDSKAFTEWMVCHGVDFVHVSATATRKGLEEMNKGSFIQLASVIKKVVDVPVIGVGAIRELSKADAIIEKGDADLVAIGRALVADPELIAKTLRGEENNIVECLDCWDCISTMNDMSGDGMKCPQNPELP